MTTAFCPKETAASETRVAVSPESAKRLVQSGVQVAIEGGAGRAAGFEDPAYSSVGAQICGTDGWRTGDLVLKVAPPSLEEVQRLKAGAVLVATLYPAANLDLVNALRERKVSTLALDLVPRISRAQSMDVLSSQATVAGYKAVLLGASHMVKMCPLLMTAAGTVRPARAVIFGVGVAGLQAIATAKRLGCLVEATDIRRATKDQVESLGGRFIDVPGAEDMETAGGYAKEVSPEFLEKQRAEVAKRVADADMVITTALVPGRKAPRLVSRAMVESMRPGSVVVDLAVESGGNCELSVLGEVVTHRGVKIVGLPNLPATVPLHASELFAKNVLNLVKLFVDKDGKMATDFADEVLAGCLLTHAGEVRHAPTAQSLGAGSSR
jgi:H+-translocating NAD(P) transhydrogenase subunit alpha